MSTDNTRARNPFTRRVVVTKPRDDEAADSNLATARGDDLSTTEDFSGVGGYSAFQAFQLTAGPGSPGDRERGTFYAVKIPDIDGKYVILVNSAPIAAPLRECVIQASYEGIVLNNDVRLAVGVWMSVGGDFPFPINSGFTGLSQTFVDPDTTPSELTSPVVQYTDGTFQFTGELLEGDVKMRLGGELSVDTNPTIPVEWVVQSSGDDGNTWSDFAPLAEETYKETNSPREIGYEMKWKQHFQGTWYRIRLRRNSGPAGDMIVTVNNFWIEFTLKIKKI